MRIIVNNEENLGFFQKWEIKRHDNKVRRKERESKKRVKGSNLFPSPQQFEVIRHLFLRNSIFS